jgi:hypothetical protein
MLIGTIPIASNFQMQEFRVTSPMCFSIVSSYHKLNHSSNFQTIRESFSSWDDIFKEEHLAPEFQGIDSLQAGK